MWAGPRLPETRSSIPELQILPREDHEEGIEKSYCRDAAGPVCVGLFWPAPKTNLSCLGLLAQMNRFLVHAGLREHLYFN
jgi:hypothetical protein